MLMSSSVSTKVTVPSSAYMTTFISASKAITTVRRMISGSISSSLSSDLISVEASPAFSKSRPLTSKERERSSSATYIAPLSPVP